MSAHGAIFVALRGTSWALRATPFNDRSRFGTRLRRYSKPRPPCAVAARRDANERRYIFIPPGLCSRCAVAAPGCDTRGERPGRAARKKWKRAGDESRREKWRVRLRGYAVWESACVSLSARREDRGTLRLRRARSRGGVATGRRKLSVSLLCFAARGKKGEGRCGSPRGYTRRNALRGHFLPPTPILVPRGAPGDRPLPHAEAASQGHSLTLPLPCLASGVAAEGAAQPDNGRWRICRLI